MVSIKTRSTGIVRRIIEPKRNGTIRLIEPVASREGLLVDDFVLCFVPFQSVHGPLPSFAVINVDPPAPFPGTTFTYID